MSDTQENFLNQFLNADQEKKTKGVTEKEKGVVKSKTIYSLHSLKESDVSVLRSSRFLFIFRILQWNSF